LVLTGSIAPQQTQTCDVAANAMIQQMARLQKHVSIGIGYGELIMISRDNHYSDVYGEQMNLASKLGEDLGLFRLEYA